MMGKEYPVFVPVGDHHIAAVVSIPRGGPRGVVVFTTGAGGALRSQRFRLWTRTARGLAERGIASVRMEYAGVGESTGTPSIGFRNLPVDDVVAIAEFAMSVTGTGTLGLCGNCAGARTALRAVSSLPTCRSLALFWLKPLASTKRAGKGSRAIVRAVMGLPKPIRRLASRTYWRREMRTGQGAEVGRTLRAAAHGRDLLLVETRSELAGQIPRLVEELRRTNDGHRIELRSVQSTSMQAFQSIGWFDRSFAADHTTEGNGASRADQPASVEPAV
jgi:dienelactone hydrolase